MRTTARIKNACSPKAKVRRSFFATCGADGYSHILTTGAAAPRCSAAVRRGVDCVSRDTRITRVFFSTRVDLTAHTGTGAGAGAGLGQFEARDEVRSERRPVLVARVARSRAARRGGRRGSPGCGISMSRSQGHTSYNCQLTHIVIADSCMHYAVDRVHRHRDSFTE